MNTKLIYYTPETASGGVSPFDVTILEMVEGHELRIACPYLGLDYLKRRMIDPSDDWRLVTDVEEWLSIHPAKARGEIVDFIVENGERIHHCRDVHAKVLIAGNRALVGSANFTEKGITGRVEMSVRIESADEVDELKAWFDLLWRETASVKEVDLRACAASLPEPISALGAFELPCAHRGVKAAFSGAAIPGENADAEQRLIDVLRLAPDRQWMINWLDLAKELIEITGLKDGDQRLVMSIRRTYLPISINQRYVLTAFRINAINAQEHSGGAAIELILPDKLVRINPTFHVTDSFRPMPAPHLVSFWTTSILQVSSKVRTAWHEVCLSERERGTKASHSNKHETVVYRAVMDSGFRQMLLDRAFADG